MAADMVMLDKDLDSICKGVLIGRMTYGNTIKCALASKQAHLAISSIHALSCHIACGGQAAVARKCAAHCNYRERNGSDCGYIASVGRLIFCCDYAGTSSLHPLRRLATCSASWQQPSGSLLLPCRQSRFWSSMCSTTSASLPSRGRINRYYI